MHALLRPHAGRDDAGLRTGLPDRVDPVRAARAAARRAGERLAQVVEAGTPGARLYGEDPDDGVGGFGAFFLLLDEPEVYGLPPAPVDATRHLPSMWRAAAAAGAGLVGTIALAFLGGRR